MIDLRNDKRIQNYLAAIVVAASAALFFYIAFFPLELWIKVAVLLAELALTGFVLHKLSGAEFHYGVLLVRGIYGFKEMQQLARKHAALFRELTDFGLSLGFGIAYAYYVFRNNFKKFLFHYAIVVIFFLFFYATQPANYINASAFIALIAGVVAGLFGFGLFVLAEHAYNIFTVAGTPPGVGVLLPGVTVPYETIIAIAIIVVVHELAHGVLCRIEGLEVKSSGALLLGFVPLGAFVEPDEKKMEKIALHKKRRILVAGSTSNIVFFALFLALFVGFNTATASERENLAYGVEITAVEKGSSADGILAAGDVIVGVGATETNTIAELQNALAGRSEGDTIIFRTSDGGVKKVGIGEDGLIGITLANKPVAGKETEYAAISLINTILFYTVFLNLVIAVINLLPLFITDGHRILYEELNERLGKKNAFRASTAVGLFALGLLIANALPWFFH